MNKHISLALAMTLAVGTVSIAAPTAGWAATDEITVTVRKRAENKQDIPMSIEAFTAEDLERRNMVAISDLAASTPGLSIEQQGSGGFVTPVIRGMAQNVISTDLSYDNNVGIFVNGIYQSGRNSVDLELVGIDRVEVARGPQSALYGRSSFAGAINYVYSVPQDEAEGTVTATLGSDEDYGATVDLGGPLVGDSLSGRISLGYREFDGTVGNLAGGDNLQGYESTAGAAALVFTPNEQFTATLNMLYSDRTNDQDAQFLVPLNCGDNGMGTPTYRCGTLDAQGDVDISGNGFADAKVEQYSLKLEFDTDLFTVTSVTGITKSDYNTVLDRDYGSLELGTGLTLGVCTPVAPGVPCFVPTGGFDTGVQSYAHSDSETDDFSQEFRITSAASEGLTWMLGAFYYESDTETRTAASLGNDQLLPGTTYTGFFAPPFLVADPFTQSNPFNNFDADTREWSLFAQAGFDITDELNFNAEGRYTNEDKETHITYNLFPTDETYKRSYSYFSPRLTLSYEPKNNENLLIYASAAKGVRTGGINGGVTGCSPFGGAGPACSAAQARERFFDPEENWTYEIGTKNTLLDGALQLNTAIYYTDWTDMQLPELNADAFGTHVTNVNGGADIYGLEVDGAFALSEMVTITGGYGYTKPEFKSGTLDGSVVSSCGTDGSLCNIVMTPGGLLAADVGGNTLGRTAEHQLNLGLLLEGQLGDSGLNWYAQTNVNYQSENFARSINALEYGERTLVDLRVAVYQEAYEIAFWAKNVFDDEYVNAQALQPGLDGNRRIDAYQGNGRRFGVTGTYRF